MDSGSSPGQAVSIRDRGYRAEESPIGARTTVEKTTTAVLGAASCADAAFEFGDVPFQILDTIFKLRDDNFFEGHADG
jgi:hypothetical protein